ncbi:MAG TPA: nitroreductase [Sphingomicrobium sp.]|nr:nitroreductase [Sphingomicrobium sp.]
MLNDRSSILSLLETRRSGKPRELVGPGPTPVELERMLTIAARTPDHGTLTPWRFVTVGDDQRDAFEAVLQQALIETEPDAADAKRQKEHDFAHYQGALVVLVSAPVPDHKIPVWEQELSCGAAGMNLLLAAHALGFVAGWVTGWRAYSERVRSAFGAQGERIAGFIFIGHASRDLEDRERPDPSAVRKPWQPPSI